jgi:hypothetical protein
MLPMLTDINASELPSAAMIARLGQGEGPGVEDRIAG